MPYTSNRRFLSLRPEPPCAAVSPASLLRALTTIALEISTFDSTRSPIHRSNIRDVIRLVRLLHPILDSISAPAAILDLYLAFQKLRLLLHDCTRVGARLLLLLRSNRVGLEFSTIRRAIADAIAGGEFDDEDDAGIAQLASRQASRNRIFSDPESTCVVKIAHAALGGFEIGNPPECDEIQNLLEHLGIRCWTEMNNEVTFLEEEIRLSTDSGEVTADLWSLLAFALYSRSMCCEAPNRLDDDETVPGGTGLDWVDPEELRCPISLDPMTDPVILSTGHTYDRSSILRWFKAGNLTCPVTGEKLPNREFTTNLTLRGLIDRCCSDQVTGGSRRTVISETPDSLAAYRALRTLAEFLVEKLRDGTENDRRRAVYEIRLIARSIVFGQRCLINTDGVRWLLHLLGSLSCTVQEHAMAALVDLSKHRGGRKAIAESGGLVLVIDMLREGSTVDTKQNAAAALFYLSSIVEYRATIGETSGVVEALVELLRSGTVRGKRNAISALFGLLAYPGNHSRVIAAGAIPILATVLSLSEREELVVNALTVLAALAEREEGTEAILQSGAVWSMMEVMRSSESETSKECCVTIMLLLCNNGGRRAVAHLDELPEIMPALYSMVVDGSPRTGKKARLLLGILHRSVESRARGLCAAEVIVR